jgi:predicted TIM-barrel fold metal-dependent hydrolase
MDVVDTHVHIMAGDRRRYPRQVAREIDPRFGWSRLDFPGEALLAAMDEGGVAKALLVQAFNAYRDDNSYVADMAKKSPERFREVCIIDARMPDPIAKLDAAAARGAVQLRIMMQDQGYRLDDARVQPLIARAVEHKMPVCIYIFWDQIGLVAPVLERHRGHPFALDHFANPPLDEGAPYASMKPLFDLARYDNLHLKFSSSTFYNSMKTGGTRVLFETVLGHFGADRLMWGSNFPMDNRRDIPGLLRLAQEQLAFLPEGDRAKLFGGNALRLCPFR